MWLRSLLVLSSIALGAETAHAATCSFDDATGVLSVDTQGGSSRLEVATGGAIELDGAGCGSATTGTTARIVVTGIDSVRETIVLAGAFSPGRNDVPESDTPEIEIEIAFTDGNDSVQVEGTGAAEVWRFTAEGINLNRDLDADIALPASGRVQLDGLGGDDVLDAHAYTGRCKLWMYGGPGADVVTGSPNNDHLFGNSGNDTIRGRAGNDTIYDGPGADIVRAGSGIDRVKVAPSADPGDDFGGGDGIDILSYQSRQNGLTVSTDMVADDGEPGENDNVHVDVEGVIGGAGDDVLVGDGGFNELYGGAGNDELYGGGGADHLFGSDGADVLVGDAGEDLLFGGLGNDVLDGGAGRDELVGEGGDDVFYNADGVIDRVDCGDGIDDPEPDPLDTFIGCENI